mmetsp:Transcript_43449/g.108115  ORF Transcript_43449/g.108115 Transcript_43449/m.108115 type:complete len:83 (+) Transcript_43449:174-422(+)
MDWHGHMVTCLAGRSGLGRELHAVSHAAHFAKCSKPSSMVFASSSFSVVLILVIVFFLILVAHATLLTATIIHVRWIGTAIW